MIFRVSHYNYECTGVGHTTAPKRYDEVPDKYKGALYDEDLFNLPLEE